MKLTPHFTFDSKAKEALDFYTSVFNGQVEMVLTYKDCAEDCPLGMSDKDMERIMYSAFSFGNDNLIAICDSFPGSGMQKDGNTVFMDLELKANEVKPIFEALSNQGNVLCPLMKTSWSEQFGCLTDKYGICWNIMEEEKK